MAWTEVEGWAGRVWVSEKGKRTFHIRQVKGGRLWEYSTKCSTLKSALKELERFESMEPSRYKPMGCAAADRLVLNEALIEEYAKWCVEQADNTDPNWVKSKKRYLLKFAEQFDGKPLNTITLKRIHECLDGQASLADRIKSIKHLYSWLRQKGRITSAEDPTLDALPVPQSLPEQDSTGESKVISEEDFKKTLPEMPPVVADLCRIMASTGCHLSEALRVMTTGKIERRNGTPVLCFLHKGKHIHRIEVTEAVAQAAERLFAAEVPGRSTVYRDIWRACFRTCVEPWTPGRFRHTFATNAVQRGVPPHEIARALGHKGQVTMLRWYATTAVAPKIGGYEV